MQCAKTVLSKVVLYTIPLNRRSNVFSSKSPAFVLSKIHSFQLFVLYTSYILLLLSSSFSLMSKLWNLHIFPSFCLHLLLKKISPFYSFIAINVLRSPRKARSNQMVLELPWNYSLTVSKHLNTIMSNTNSESLVLSLFPIFQKHNTSSITQSLRFLKLPPKHVLRLCILCLFSIITRTHFMVFMRILTAFVHYWISQHCSWIILFAYFLCLTLFLFGSW